MKIKELVTLILIVLVAALFYLCFPKYEIYQTPNGTYVYRFNKITGTIQIGEPKDGKWYRAMPVGVIKKL